MGRMVEATATHVRERVLTLLGTSYSTLPLEKLANYIGLVQDESRESAFNSHVSFLCGEGSWFPSIQFPTVWKDPTVAECEKLGWRVENGVVHLRPLATERYFRPTEEDFLGRFTKTVSELERGDPVREAEATLRVTSSREGNGGSGAAGGHDSFATRMGLGGMLP